MTPENPMRRKLVEIHGIRTKFRTEDRWATAVLWKDGAPVVEVSRLNLEVTGAPGSPGYQGWVDAVSAVVHEHLSRISGVEGITGKRKKPDYSGEE